MLQDGMSMATEISRYSYITKQKVENMTPKIFIYDNTNMKDGNMKLHYIEFKLNLDKNKEEITEDTLDTLKRQS